MCERALAQSSLLSGMDSACFPARSWSLGLLHRRFPPSAKTHNETSNRIDFGLRIALAITFHLSILTRQQCCQPTVIRLSPSMPIRKLECAALRFYCLRFYCLCSRAPFKYCGCLFRMFRISVLRYFLLLIAANVRWCVFSFGATMMISTVFASVGMFQRSYFWMRMSNRLGSLVMLPIIHRAHPI